VIGGALAQPVAGADPQTWTDILRHDVIPVATAFAGFVALLLSYRRRRKRGEPVRVGTEPVGGTAWTRLLRYLVVTAAGGYVLFLVIVWVFYLVLGGKDRTLLEQALKEGSMLAFLIVVPGFLAIEGLHELGRRLAGRARPALERPPPP
jgi:Family of unknown function (DUF6256)